MFSKKENAPAIFIMDKKGFLYYISCTQKVIISFLAAHVNPALTDYGHENMLRRRVSSE